MTELKIEKDELAPLMRKVAFSGVDVLDLGCGAGGLTRRFVAEAGVALAIGMDADSDQIRRNAAAAGDDGVRYMAGEAQNLPLPEASLDVVVMMKSLHHVPVPRMDDAMAEIARVLRPSGCLYVCEPAYEGDFNDLIVPFHDEGPERAAALAAIERATRGGLFRIETRADYIRPLRFASLSDFREKMMNLPWLKGRITAETEAEVEARWRRHGPTDAPVNLSSRMLVFVMRKAAAYKLVKTIRRKTRQTYSSEEKIRIVLAGLRCEETISVLCRRGGISESLYYSW